MKTNIAVDTSGILVSSLCLVHCLIFPILGSISPVIGIWSENEWVHKCLVLLALPLCINLLVRPRKTSVFILALSGLSLLFAGAFAEILHDYETELTVIGAILLSFAHLQRLQIRRHMH